MGTRKNRPADRSLRPPMRSPGRPPGWRREHLQRLWESIAGGLPSEEAAVAAGWSPAVGSRWFRQSGGMRPFTFVPLSGRYPSSTEREEIAILHAQECSVREIARRLERSPSTIWECQVVCVGGGVRGVSPFYSGSGYRSREIWPGK
jgi:hypothetical protein